ncbi:uncharacterized protein IL334_005707 [Kwoniella shivajii]|uniref:Ig-like domain-containing protein n=1 Tax=Kwoniella shivajii TaxID=564305 RepID=A0ABZ1D7V4_9TREE|nr:hypothetical protein IL334_005707 [Kwoniella shivajii]
MLISTLVPLLPLFLCSRIKPVSAYGDPAVTQISIEYELGVRGGYKNVLHSSASNGAMGFRWSQKELDEKKKQNFYVEYYSLWDDDSDEDDLEDLKANISCTIEPKDAVDSPLTWKFSNPKIKYINMISDVYGGDKTASRIVCPSDGSDNFKAWFGDGIDTIMRWSS